MAQPKKTMNESALYQISMALDAYSEIEGIFVVKGMVQQLNAMAWKINLDGEGKDYANKLRLLFTNLVKSSLLLGLEYLDEIIFEMDKRCLILRKIVMSKGKTPIFMSIITKEKPENLQAIDMIFDELAEELQLVL